MKRIKEYTKDKKRYIGKINRKLQVERIPKEEESAKIEEVQEIIQTENKSDKGNCFALVVVRKLPWYKRLARNIRNYIVIYRWRKSR